MVQGRSSDTSGAFGPAVAPGESFFIGYLGWQVRSVFIEESSLDVLIGLRLVGFITENSQIN